MLSRDQLSTPMSRAAVLDFLLDVLKELKFPVAGWVEGKIQHTFLMCFSTFGADATEMIKAMADMYTPGKAKGPFLTAYSQSFFDNWRKPGTATIGPVIFTSTSPIDYTKQPGEITTRSRTGVLFQNKDTVTVAANAQTPVSMRCTLVGEVGNVAADSIRELVTTLAGVTINNPVGAGGTWYTTLGTDPEEDANLDTRNRTKWSRMSLEWVEDAYINCALALPGVTKSKVNAQNPRGAGTVNVYVSGPYALLGDDLMANAQLEFSRRTFGTSSTWPVPTTTPPSHVALAHPPVYEFKPKGILYYDARHSPAEFSSIVDESLKRFLSLLNLGAHTLPPYVSPTLVRNEFIEHLESTRGLISSTIVTPAGDVPLGSFQLCTPPSSGWFGADGLTLAPVTK